MVLFCSQVLNAFIKEGRVLHAEEIDNVILQELEKTSSRVSDQPQRPSDASQANPITERPELPNATIYRNDSGSPLDEIGQGEVGQVAVGHHVAVDSGGVVSGTTTDQAKESQGSAS